MTPTDQSPVGSRPVDVSANPLPPAPHGQTTAAFACAFVAYLSGEQRSLAAAARAFGCGYQPLRRWTLRPEQRAFARTCRRPITKPSGALL